MYHLKTVYQKSIFKVALSMLFFSFASLFGYTVLAQSCLLVSVHEAFRVTLKYYDYLRQNVELSDSIYASFALSLRTMYHDGIINSEDEAKVFDRSVNHLFDWPHQVESALICLSYCALAYFFNLSLFLVAPLLIISTCGQNYCDYEGDNPSFGAEQSRVKRSVPTPARPERLRLGNAQSNSKVSSPPPMIPMRQGPPTLKRKSSSAFQEPF